MRSGDRQRENACIAVRQSVRTHSTQVRPPKKDAGIAQGELDGQKKMILKCTYGQQRRVMITRLQLAVGMERLGRAM